MILLSFLLFKFFFMINNIFLFLLKLVSWYFFFLFFCFKFLCIVVLIKLVLFFGRYVSVFLKVVYIFLVNFKEILLVNLGVKFDLCMIVGIFKECVVIIIGILIKLFFEKSKFGFCFLSILCVFKIFFKILKIFFVFLKDR